MWFILPLLLLHIIHHPPEVLTPQPTVFFNTTPPISFHYSINCNSYPAMDTIRQKQTPQENLLSIPLSLIYHQVTLDSMSNSFHFSYAREMEQMKAKQEHFYAVRHARIEKQKEKLDNCSDLPKCCNRYLQPTPPSSSHCWILSSGTLLRVVGGLFSRSCCVNEKIPASYLEEVRRKYLNYDTRAQRKDFLLNCTDTHSRYCVCFLVHYCWCIV